VFRSICSAQAVLVVFPGKEDAFGPAYTAMTEANLVVKHLVWFKGQKGGTTGARVNYLSENILVGWTQPEVRSWCILRGSGTCRLCRLCPSLCLVAFESCVPVGTW